MGRRRAALACLGVWAALAAGCAQGGFSLAVDLRTDYAPGFEFDEVRTELVSGRGEEVVIEEISTFVSADQDFLTGRRVADLDVGGNGAYTVRVTLLADGAAVAGRSVRITLDSSFGLVVLITHSCGGVSCPGPGDEPGATTCAGGRCVSPACGPDNPAACGTPACDVDGDCPAGVPCARGRCMDGFCLRVPIGGVCVPGEWCSVERGCLPVTGMCQPDDELCDGRDNDCDDRTDEGFDLVNDPAHCGDCDTVCGRAHATSAACVASACVLACEMGFADCNRDPADGCETALPPAGCPDGCGDMRMGGEETDVDCGGPLCPRCAADRQCIQDSDCAAGLRCGGGRCVACGECTPGATENVPCGACGMQTRTCSAACTWDPFGACGGEGECAPGTMRSVACGRCGMATESCGLACTWGAAGACSGEGPCAPGATDAAGCPGLCMVRTCDATCTFPPVCDQCASTCMTSLTVCSLACPPGYHATSQSCSSTCTSGSCVGAPDNQSRCARTCGTTLTQCGLSCPAGYYPSSYSCDTSCTSATSCAGQPDNEATCRLVAGSTLTLCGLTCPSGYYASSRSCDTSCTSATSCAGQPDNETTCRLIEGTTFTACGTTCPAGYVVTGSRCSTSCTSASSCAGQPDNQVTCRLL